jgi:hypothetical protein
MKKPIYFLIAFFLFLFLFIFINAYLKKKEEYNNKYDFIVTKIKSDSKGYLIFSDINNNTYSFVSYKFIKWDNLGIIVGDKIFKDSCSNVFLIYRKNQETEKYELFLKKEEN